MESGAFLGCVIKVQPEVQRFETTKTKSCLLRLPSFTNEAVILTMQNSEPYRDIVLVSIPQLPLAIVRRLSLHLAYEMVRVTSGPALMPLESRTAIPESTAVLCPWLRSRAEVVGARRKHSHTLSIEAWLCGKSIIH